MSLIYKMKSKMKIKIGIPDLTWRINKGRIFQKEKMMIQKTRLRIKIISLR